MKKIISLVLAFTMATLVGCSATSTSSTVESSTETSTQSSTESSVETPVESSTEASTEDSTETISVPMTIASLKGPTAMGLVSLMDKNEAGEASLEYTFPIHGTPDQITGPLLTGEIDGAAIPANLAATLYNKSQGAIKVIGINTLGVLYIVEGGETINSIEDLKGKTLYSTGKGTTPEFALNYILTSNGIDPTTDLTIEYKSESTEVAALLAQDPTAIAVLPQPYVATVLSKNPDSMRVALNLTEEWDKIGGDSSLVTGVTVVTTKFIEENPQAVESFLEEYSQSVELVNSDLTTGAALVAKYEITTEEVALEAIPQCNIVLIEGEEMKNQLSGYLDVLFTANPESVGGAMPDGDFYYIP